jgi:hypothetical protein
MGIASKITLESSNALDSPSEGTPGGLVAMTLLLSKYVAAPFCLIDTYDACMVRTFMRDAPRASSDLSDHGPQPPLSIRWGYLELLSPQYSPFHGTMLRRFERSAPESSILILRFPESSIPVLRFASRPVSACPRFHVSFLFSDSFLSLGLVLAYDWVPLPRPIDVAYISLYISLPCIKYTIACGPKPSQS